MNFWFWRVPLVDKWLKTDRHVTTLFDNHRKGDWVTLKLNATGYLNLSL